MQIARRIGCTGIERGAVEHKQRVGLSIVYDANVPPGASALEQFGPRPQLDDGVFRYCHRVTAIVARRRSADHGAGQVIDDLNAHASCRTRLDSIVIQSRQS